MATVIGENYNAADVEVLQITNATGVTKGQLVKAYSTDTTYCTVSSGGESVIGVSLETVTTQSGQVQIATKGQALKVPAQAAIAVCTSGRLTEVIAGSAGTVKALGATTGSAVQILGHMHPRSPASTAAGDYVTIVFAPYVRYVVASA